MSRGLRCAVCAGVLLALLAGSAGWAAPPTWPGTVEAVRSDWNAHEPPETGWIETELPDDWSRRWPNHDGVVWYRLQWDQAMPTEETALYLEYLTFAGEIRLNGALLARDENLVEPLSRMWNVPRYWRLPSPLLRPGRNTLLIRVSGFAQYTPGLGPTLVGDAGALMQRFRSDRWVRRTINQISLSVSLTVGMFFLVVWLMRRSEVAFGWYAAGRFAWLPVAWNTLAIAPWPFATTDAYQNLTALAVPISIGCGSMFVLRYCDRRWPRRERLLWGVLLLSALWILVAPHDAKLAARNVANALSVVVVVVTDLAFLWFAWRGGRADQKFLSVTSSAVIAAGVHDALGVAGVIEDTTNWGSMTAMMGMISASFVLAWNFVDKQRRIEGFNAELSANVEQARAELASTLSRRHELEMMHARLGERVSLAHDLHDGLGGMLIGNIAALEQGPEQVPTRKMLDALRELRDDLRLIIDTAAAQHYGENSLGELLAPLRHRMSRLFEAYEIEMRWQSDRLDDVYLTNTQSLDLLRIAQEALTNVLKHAQARRVEVELRNSAQALTLEVRDDGNGMPEGGPRSGTGMRSMQSRARRLAAHLSVASDGQGTLVRLHRPWPETG